MKTITYDGKTYKVAFVSADSVVVNLPELEIYGYQSRMPIPLHKFSRRVQNIAKKSLTR